MQTTIATWVVQMILARLQSEDVRVWMEHGLDLLEKMIAESPNKYDDIVGLPMIQLFRDSFKLNESDMVAPAVK